MPRSGLRLGIGLLVAVLALTALSASATAIHDQDDYIVDETYTVAGTEEDRVFFEMTSTDPVCYGRSLIPGTAGTWTMQMYDALKQPFFGEAGVWTNKLGGPFTENHAPIPFFLVDGGGLGTWTMTVQGTGFSPAVRTVVTVVDSVEDCKHPPAP